PFGNLCSLQASNHIEVRKVASDRVHIALAVRGHDNDVWKVDAGGGGGDDLFFQLSGPFPGGNFLYSYLHCSRSSGLEWVAVAIPTNDVIFTFNAGDRLRFAAIHRVERWLTLSI